MHSLPATPRPGSSAPAADGSYRERLSPSLWLLVSAAVVGPMVALVLTPVGAAWAVVAGVVAGLGVVAVLVVASPVVAVRDGELAAGRARIPVTDLGDPVAFDGEDARHARGPGLDARSWLAIRGGIDGLVVVSVIDPDDPTPAWVLSTRTPDRLAAAIRRAQVRQRTPRR